MGTILGLMGHDPWTNGAQLGLINRNGPWTDGAMITLNPYTYGIPYPWTKTAKLMLPKPD